MSMVQLTEVESGSPAKPSRVQWTWNSPDAPIRINIAFNVIARLRAEIEQSAPRTEVGGVLLGHATQTPATLDIQDYALLPPDRDSAGNYCLDIAQLQRLRHKRSDLSVVGYFRTQPDGALHLRRPEVSLVADHFNHATDVVLLIRTVPHQFRAGFLFWDTDAFVQFSVHDFPFDATSLAQDEPVAERPVPFTPRMEQPAAVFRDPLIDEPVAQRKPTHVRRNVLAACIGVAALIGLSPLLLRNSVNGPLKSTVATTTPAAARPADTTPKVATPVTSAASAPQNLRVPPPIPTAAKTLFAAMHPSVPLPPPPTPASLPRAPASATSPVSTPERRVSPTPDAVPPPSVIQPAASAPATEPAPPPPPIPASVAPAVVAREQPPANPPVVTPPVASAPAAKEPVPAPVPAAATPPVARPNVPVGRFAGGWSYPLNNGLYHGSQPEIVEVSIQESNGRLSGTAYARFKAPNEPARTLRFQFAGELRPGRFQSFNMETVDGAKGSIELIPGTSPNLLELYFRTMPADGNVQTGNMILVKR